MPGSFLASPPPGAWRGPLRRGRAPIIQLAIAPTGSDAQLLSHSLLEFAPKPHAKLLAELPHLRPGVVASWDLTRHGDASVRAEV